MPYEMIWEQRGLHRRYYGCTSDVEVAESTVLLESSPQFDEIRYSILDFLDIEGLVLVNPSYIEEAAAIDSAAAMSQPNLKVAIVTVSPEIKRLAEEYIAHPLNAYPTEIFSNMADARNWVAIEIPQKHRPRRIMES